MPEITHHFVKTNGIKMHVAESGQGIPVVMCHGFPEVWYSWRHQIKALAEAGFRAIAPDQRGYGETDCPEPIAAYSQKLIAADIIGMLRCAEPPRLQHRGTRLGWDDRVERSAHVS